jgi:hypothetical protein
MDVERMRERPLQRTKVTEYCNGEALGQGYAGVAQHFIEDSFGEIADQKVALTLAVHLHLEAFEANHEIRPFGVVTYANAMPGVEAGPPRAGTGQHEAYDQPRQSTNVTQGRHVGTSELSLRP